VIDWLIDEFKKAEGIDLRTDRQALQRLKAEAEKAKIELSSAQQTEINLPFITADASGPKHLNLTITRAKLEQLVGDLLSGTLEPVKKALADAGKKPGDIDEIVLVGGQTRMPSVQKIVADFFGKEPHKGVNPDEVVAIGAAIQAGVLRGEVKDVLLLDVTPLTLGIETLGGVSTPIIPRNTTIPTAKSQVFSTAADNQPSVEIHVLQGERPMATDNKSLGRFILDGILPAPRGVPQVEVTFDIDANGIVSVSAKDKGTGREQKIILQASSGLSKDEIAKMQQEAELHADEDRKKREAIELKNLADSTAYQAERTLRDNADKISAELKEEVEGRVKDVREAIAAEDTDRVQSALDALSQSMQKIGEAVYGAAGAAGGDGAGPGAEGFAGAGAGAASDGPASTEGTVEGEFREV
jgi:molecular chaperone DnaK